jgi:release factor glutamine methyltransferase
VKREEAVGKKAPPGRNEEPTVADRVWRVGDLLDWTRRFFEERGLESPRLTTELLLSCALNCQRIHLYTRYDQPTSDEERARFRTLVERRIARVPVAYLTHQVHFLTFALYVDERVMVPRPETEVLVEAYEARVAKGPGTVLDVGTGSGVIALAVARRRPETHVIASDISSDALAVAERNVAEHKMQERVELVPGDLLAPMAGREFPGGLTAVLANLPYVSEADLAAAEPEVRVHEPRLALDGGPDGLRVIRRLIDQAPALCPPGAWLLLEVGAGQAEPVAALLTQQGAWQTPDRVRDYAGHERVVAARRRVEG